jgi:hypothetical protein
MIDKFVQMWKDIMQAIDPPKNKPFLPTGTITNSEQEALDIISQMLPLAKVREIANIRVHCASQIYIRGGNPGFRPPKTYLEKTTKDLLNKLSTEHLTQVIEYCSEIIGDKDITLRPY